MANTAIIKSRRPPRDVEPEAFPVGCTVRTPTGRLATVQAMRGSDYDRHTREKDHLIRIVCKYITPEHRDENCVLLAPSLLTLVCT